jgi:hypothetical protein
MGSADVFWKPAAPVRPAHGLLHREGRQRQADQVMIPDKDPVGPTGWAELVNVATQRQRHAWWNWKLPFAAGLDPRESQSLTHPIDIVESQAGDLAGTQAHIHHQERHRMIATPASRQAAKGRQKPFPIEV